VPAPGSGKHEHLAQGQGLVNAFSPGIVYETGWTSDGNQWITPQSLPTTVFHDGVATNYSDAGSSTWFPTWTGTPGNQENLPINYVRWYEAYAFCIWDGGFLPSEAEWEYAAAGGSDEREYPWGATDPGTNNEYAIFRRNGVDCNYPDGGPCTGPAIGIAPVGTAAQGAGRWGQVDLTGNVEEWTLDSPSSNYPMPYPNPCVDCAGLLPSTSIYFYSAKVVRGGDYASWITNSLPPTRSANDPHDPGPSLGFRCARAP
jgi:formylglycine-generating enzyme required for sulfatase activity